MFIFILSVLDLDALVGGNLTFDPNIGDGLSQIPKIHEDRDRTRRQFNAGCEKQPAVVSEDVA